MRLEFLDFGPAPPLFFREPSAGTFLFGSGSPAAVIFLIDSFGIHMGGHGNLLFELGRRYGGAPFG